MLATVIVAIVLLTTAAAVMLITSRQLYDNLDHALEQRADEVESTVESTVESAGSDRALFTSDPEDRFAQVVNGSGVVIASTPNVAGSVITELTAGGGDDPRTIEVARLDGDAFRVLVRAGAIGGGEVGSIVVGEQVGDLRRELQILAIAMAIVFPFAVAVLAAAVWWLVGRTLRPVERIRAEVATIGLDRIDRRVPTPGTGDEIDRLAGTMNAMLDRLDRSVSAQRRFVADASHELRTPLTRMRTTLEVERAQPPASGDPVATCESVLDDVVTMQSTINDLLFLAHRDASGTPTARFGPVDLDVVVDAEVAAARQAGASIAIDMSAVSAAAADGSASQLARLVRNLLSNASRHARTSIWVSLSDTPDGVILTVDDDGPGIPAAERRRVFERFVRLDPARRG